MWPPQNIWILNQRKMQALRFLKLICVLILIFGVNSLTPGWVTAIIIFTCLNKCVNYLPRHINFFLLQEKFNDQPWVGTQVNSALVWQLCATMMSSVGCLLTDSDIFILFARNSQILLKISVILILLTFMYLVALNLLVNNQLNSSLRHIP